VQVNLESEGCVVLFSGGRDSTVAALRLVRKFPNLTLVTVTTEHLIGMERVLQRLRELKTVMPKTVKWVHAIAQPTSLVTIGQETIESCLPCHHVYLRTAMDIARKSGAKSIALGYASYQDTWLEQTPYAVEALRSVLAEFDIDLLLPSANLTSKAEAVAVLRASGLSDAALEQKCLQQQFNSKGLSLEDSNAEIDAWRLALRKSFRAGSLTGVGMRTAVPLGEW
jgi:PP-loop superfamily ATP-utilizing enzyme